MSKTVIGGWVILVAGTMFWLFGYFTAGHPSVVDWHAHTPWWIADYLPNVESEIGMALICGSMVLIYWPSAR